MIGKNECTMQPVFPFGFFRKKIGWKGDVREGGGTKLSLIFYLLAQRYDNYPDKLI